MGAIKRFVSRSPFAVVLPALMGGIVFRLFVPLNYSQAVILGIAMGVLGALAIALAFKRILRWRFLPGVVLFLFFAALGMVLAHLHDDRSFGDFLPGGSHQVVLARVEEPLVGRPNADRSLVSVTHRRANNQWVPARGNVLIYFRKSAANAQLEPGSRLVLGFTPEEIPEPQNPGQFNYRRFMRFKNVHYQAFVGKSQWHVTEPPSGWGYQLHRWRTWLSNRYKTYAFGEHEFAVINALVLGQKQFLDPEITRAYSSAGAMHVLAVSGLHVGIVYIVIAFLLKPLGRSQRGRILQFIFALIFLWSYAALTGFSPSVQRAATMFSFLALGTQLSRKTGTYNNLSISAFILLLVNPGTIMSVGFQLSYLAVLGIVSIQPHLERLWVPRHKWVHYFWVITTVSIAAQLTTSPLSLLYFHQFPNYFLISNLFVIPAAGLILYTGLLFLFICKIPLLGFTVGWLLNKLLWLVNALLLGIDKLPYALISEIHISMFECFILYAMALLLFSVLFNVSARALWSFAGVLIVFISLQITEAIKHRNQADLIIYSSRNASAVDLIAGRNHHFLVSDHLRMDESQLLFTVKNNWFARNLKPPHVTDIDSLHVRVFSIPGSQRSFAVVDGNARPVAYPTSAVNVILLRNNPYLHFDTWQPEEGTYLVCDNTCSYNYAAIAEKFAVQYGLKFWNTRTQGAFIYSDHN